MDQRQLNLTRFPLAFPEKRGFFLEGGTFFDFFAPNEIRPFFSRRIGLDQEGVPQPIDGGLKLTGQAGRQDIGALFVRTGDAGLSPAESFGVVRVRRRVLTQSYLGGIYTYRSGASAGPGDFHTAGLDFRLMTSRFRGSQNLEFGGMILVTPNPSTNGDNLAFGARLGYLNDVWNMGVHAIEVQPNHDLAVGFLRRRGYRGYYPSLSYSPRPDGHPLIRRFSFGGDLAILTDLQNRALTREIALTLLRVESHSGDNVTLSATPTYERLERDFQIYRGVTLPAGSEYDFTRYRVGVGTASRRILAVQTGYTWGSFFSGDRREATLQLGIRPRAGVTLNVAGERNTIDLPQGSFTADLYRLIADTQVNPRIYLVNNLQYDSMSRQIGWQGRFRWIVRPGNDLFFVYTQLVRADGARHLRDARPPRRDEDRLHAPDLIHGRAARHPHLLRG